MAGPSWQEELRFVLLEIYTHQIAFSTFHTRQRLIERNARESAYSGVIEQCAHAVEIRVFQRALMRLP